MPETIKVPGGHKHGRHGYLLDSAEAVRAHLWSVHNIETATEATDENWAALGTTHQAAHRHADEDLVAPAAPGCA